MLRPTPLRSNVLALLAVLCAGGASACAGTGSPPEIEELRATSTQISQDESVVVLAMVTDPDGLDNLAGGKLVSEDGTVFYAPFEQLSNGTFASTVSWWQLHEAKPIEFETSEVRTVVARFLDNDKNEVSQPLALELTCHGQVACNGQCVDTSQDARFCGSCDLACPATDRCEQGSCVSNCEPCLETHCSLELGVCAASPACTALRDCLNACADQPCADVCSSTHADGMTVFYNLYQCYLTGCAGYCGSTP